MHNPLWLNGAIWHLKALSSLVQAIICRRFGIKWITRNKFQCNLYDNDNNNDNDDNNNNNATTITTTATTSDNDNNKFWTFIWKCRLPILGYFVQALVYTIYSIISVHSVVMFRGLGVYKSQK